ncbi:MAG: deoxyribonuclease IV [Fimbriimonadales bacterium]|nr:deoxyribonuclease IV [Fimbriimonadales bacterium]MDW8051087.1 deoxyribonuclease IV [Armatimonadota bacterium]
MQRLIGAHTSTTGGLQNALYEGKQLGCTAVQLFTASPRQWKAPPITREQVEKLNQARRETGIETVVSHAAYLINLASPDPETRRKSYEAYRAELQRCAALGIRYAVFHMGSHPDFDTGMRLLIENLRNLLAELPDGVCITMETMAGQGSTLCYRFEHFAQIYDALPDERLVICADSCHLFAAGYDLRTPDTYEAVWREFDRLIGLSRLQVWHLNDSKKPLGSRIDRHEHIGEGELGESAFRLILNDPRFAALPMIIETPDETRYAEDLAKLWSYVGQLPPAS